MRVARLSLITLLAILAGCGGSDAPQPATSPSDGGPPAAAPFDGEAPRRAVTLLWPGAEAVGLLPREAEIFATRESADQARQVVGLLLAGAPDADVFAPFPEGTTLTALFVDARGIAYVSLSREAVDKAPGGSAWESLAVHSLVGSLTRAVPQIHRLQLLIDGKEIESLAGHLDMRGPVAFDASLLAP